MDLITFSDIDAMQMTPNDIKVGSEAAFKDLDTLSRDEFIKMLHIYDLSEIVHSTSECKRLLAKYGVIPG